MKRAVFRTATMIIASASNSRRTSVIRHHKFHIFLIISNAKSVNINQICVQPSTSTTDRSDTAGIKTQNRKYTVNHSSGTVGAESGSSSQKMRHGENSLSFSLKSYDRMVVHTSYSLFYSLMTQRHRAGCGSLDIFIDSVFNVRALRCLRLTIYENIDLDIVQEENAVAEAMHV